MKTCGCRPVFTSDFTLNGFHAGGELYCTLFKMSPASSAGSTGLQCPHTWQLPEMREPAERTAKRLTDLLYVFHDPWDMIVLRVLLMFIYWRDMQFSKSLEQLEEVEKIVSSPDSYMQLRGGLAQRHTKAIQHVVQACYAHLSEDVILKSPASSSAEPFHFLDRKEQAAVWGIRSGCLYFLGSSGCYACQESARWATELDPEEAEWRRMMSGPNNTERALILERNPVTLLDAAFWAALQGDGDCASNMLIEVLATWSESPYVSMRCAAMFAASRMLGANNPTRRKKEAEECSAKAVALSDGCVLAHILRRFINENHDSVRLKECHATYGLSLDIALSKLEFCWGFEWLIRRTSWLPM